MIRIQPNEGVTLFLNSKVPGLETKLQPIRLSFGYDTTFGSNTPEAYERLILDALNGDGTLFIRGDEAETSWGLLSPLWISGVRKSHLVLKHTLLVLGDHWHPTNYFCLAGMSG